MAFYNQPMYQNQNPYAYGNQYSQQQSYMYQPQNYNNSYNSQTVTQQYPVQTQQNNVINGKIVESVDIVKTTEIPLGGWAIFPQADGKLIYLKKYLNDGSTQIVTYSPIVEEKDEQKTNMYSKTLDEIQKKIEEIDLKVSTLIS